MDGTSISASRLPRGGLRQKALATAFCVAASGVWSAGLAVGPAGGAEGPAGSTGMPGDESCLVSRINGERSGAGLPSLAIHSALVSIARRYSTHMAQNMAPRTWVHNSNLPNELPSGWKTRGENVGWATDCSSMHNFFINSPSHRKNILGTQFNYLGVGVIKDAQGDLRVTQVFMGTGESVQSKSNPAPTGQPSVAPAIEAPKPIKSSAPSTKASPSPSTAKSVSPKPVGTGARSVGAKRGKTRAYVDSLEKEPEAQEASDSGLISFELISLRGRNKGGTNGTKATFMLEDRESSGHELVFDLS